MGPLAKAFLYPLLALTVVGVVGGGSWGFARGTWNLPTLPFAVVEGAVIFGYLGLALGLLAGALALAVAASVRHTRRSHA